MSAPVTYKGAVHIHSRHSDGSGTMEEIIRAAQETGLDFIIMSDHNTLAAKEDGWGGWHDGLLVIIGAEITPDRAGHVLAMGVDTVEGYEHLSEGEYLREIARQGGVSFIAHPEGKRKKALGLDLERWRHWDMPLFAGIEIWSFMHDWIQDLRIRQLLAFHRDPLSRITGPDPSVLAAWDRLAHRRRTAGIAGLDVHARRFILRRWTFFPYDFLFRTTLTYVRTPKLTGDGESDARSVIEALARARAYIVYDILGEAHDFSFVALTQNRRLDIGDILPLEGEVTLEASIPADARIRLLCDGNLVASADGRELKYTTDQTGAYRVEAYRDEHPWILSNHIYLRKPRDKAAQEQF